MRINEAVLSFYSFYFYLLRNLVFFCKKRKPRLKVEVTVREFNRNDAKYSNNYMKIANKKSYEIIS
ncbi:hypothetical protein P7955_27 [Streptococcus phage P7955]|uniref:Uncharacterized protein n=1 Tax=Streptococcus phage P7955 TaxID=1971440 RepID=A0A286QSH7_9CAUD|nr:hypothetical protein PQF05_gp27 [Streptococcus phage P7955]ARU14396.1 hypothetical protein P7955_27 [Streptococcus phage P7955]